jgi:hypothetical protein
MVRLFLCLLFSTGAILAEEKKAEKIPRHWIEEAKKYDSRDYSAQLPIVPKYERELVRRIREHMLATNQGEHANYKSEIPETGVEYEMDLEQVRARYERIGIKKPNPRGLYDMHGNVMEWCLDAFLPSHGHLDKKDPYLLPAQRWGYIARSGSCYDLPEYLRSACRTCSNDDWQMQDPQLPKSIWRLTDAQWIGFRLTRPKEIPLEDEMYEIWNSGGVYPQEGDKEFNLNP